MKTIEEVKKAIGSKIESANCELDDLCTTEDYMIIRNLKVEINAYNDCLSLLEECEDKEKPMKASEDVGIALGHCPHCGEIVSKVSPHQYCPNCGQRIDWRKGERK